MPDYKQGKIYSIRSRSRPELIYIGSTVATLSKRMGQHRAPSSSCSSKEIINIGDAYIELIEKFPCNDIAELKARENRHLRALITVNKQSAINDCEHGRKQCVCYECIGISVCEHNRIKGQCRECCFEKYYCDFCEKSFAGMHSYKSHFYLSLHKKNYKAEFLRVFEMEITDADVPQF